MMTISPTARCGRYSNTSDNMPLGHTRLSVCSPYDDFYSVAHQDVGTVFKVVEEEYEQIMLMLQEWFPTFHAEYVHPGTDLFTIEGSGTLVVTATCTT